MIGTLWGPRLFHAAGRILYYPPMNGQNWIALPNERPWPITVIYPQGDDLGIDTEYEVYRLSGDPTEESTWMLRLESLR